MLEDFFKGRDWFGMDLGLDRVRDTLEKLGRPERDLRFVHIAGTNGKGSCGAMLEAGLRGAGFRTGFYSSPHLIDFGERFRIDSVAADKKKLEPFAERIAGEKLTYFEFATVLAILYFRAEKCDFVIWETGMGGRLDATNVVTPEASVITHVAMDHMQYLGDTLEKIAAEKAGIIKENVPAFAGIMDERALKVLALEAFAKNAPFSSVVSYPEKATYSEDAQGRLGQVFDWDNYEVRLMLPGKMQRRNFALAGAVLGFLSEKYSFDLRNAILHAGEAVWPGRLTVAGDCIIDGGHNPDGVSALVEGVKEIWPGKKFPVVFGAFADKEVEESLKELSSIASVFCFVPLPAADDSRPCRTPEELAGLVDVPVARTEEELPPGRKIVAGSLYLAGEYLKKMNVSMS